MNKTSSSYGDYCYLEFTIKLKTDPEELLPAFIKGAIVQSLTTVFGEIGGQIEFDLLAFDEKRQKVIIRVPQHSEVKAKVALILISEFQGIPAVFHINKASTQLPQLTASFIDL